MDPLSITVSIIAIVKLTGGVIEYFEEVKDASKDRAQCAIEASNLSALLTKLRYRLEEGASNELWNAEVQKLGEKDGILDQYKHALEQLHAAITSRRGIKKTGHLIRWSLIKKKVEVILTRIERLKPLVHIALEMDHIELSRVIREGVNSIQQHQDRHRHDEILDWISPTHFPAQHSDLISSKQEGTGLWFLASAEYTEWIQGLKKTLFCPGIPGAGKTMMAAITVEHLLGTVKCNTIGVAYLYCNYKLQTEYTTVSLLAAILKQLAQGRPSAAEPVVRLFNNHSSQKTRPSLGEVLGALQSIIASYSSVYLVIDALDECTTREDTRKQLFDRLRSLQSDADLRILVTSRKIPKIIKQFASEPTLEVRASEADIRQFLKEQMYKLPDFVQCDDALQRLVQEKIAGAADGMFLLARLHFDYLLDKCTKKNVRSALDELPKGSAPLDRAYDEAIKRIECQSPVTSELAKRIISWITYAERPLRTQELCHALAVETGEDELDTENIPDIKVLITACAGLVTVDEESGTIRLVHYTTQEYFKRIGEKWNPSAQLDIASTCLRYLSFSSFKSGSCSTDESLEERRVGNPLLEYAACYWAHHTFEVQREVSNLAQRFLRCDGLVSCALQITSASASRFRFPGYSQYYPRGRTTLHILAWFGLTLLLEQLIYKPGSKNATSCSLKDSTGLSPLNLAVTHGHKAVVELLMKEGADINAQNKIHGDALQAASYNGHEDIVELLLSSGAVIESNCGHFGSALQAAASNGHEHIVKLLLSRGAAVNINCGNFGTSLQAAAFRGHQQVVKLLLDEGAKVNAQGGQYANALQAASFAGHKQIVELLLDEGAIVYPRGDESLVLQAAVENGHDQIVGLLISKGGNVDVQGERYAHALYTASYKGFKQIVQLLLKGNADVNAQSEVDESALHAAACNGYEDIVELLLENGADVNMESELYGSALQGASYGGHAKIVELLLEANANIHAQSGHYGSALQAAACNGHAQVIKLLLDSGANVNAQSGHYGGALQAAAFNGHAQIVKLLLSSGANVNAEGGVYGSAIQAAVCNDHQNVFQLLLKNGVKVDFEDIMHDKELLLLILRLQIRPRGTRPSGVDKCRRYSLYRRYIQKRRVHVSNLGTRQG